MSTQNSTKKTYVGGSFLYSQDGLGYEQGRNEVTKTKEKIIQDRLGIQEYQKEMREKKIEINNKKKNAQVNKIVQKPTLIPIRDTPVQPVPEPVLENQKCERATQEQFEYFQTYISQKQKERKFQEQQERQLQLFEFNQRKLKERSLQEEQRNQVLVVMEKEEQQKKIKPMKKVTKIRPKKKIAKEKEDDAEKLPAKVRILEPDADIQKQ